MKRAVVMQPPERHPPSLETLLATLLSTTEPLEARVEAATQLAEHSEEPQSVHALLTLIQHETEPRLLMHVFGVLGRKKIYSAVMPLIDVMLCTGHSAIERSDTQFAHSDGGMRVRISAIQALGRIGDDRALVPLMSILSTAKENYRLRLAAAESLGRLGDTQALNPLINIVKDEGESSQYLKESAIKALGMLGDLRALDPLLEMFESQKGIKNKFNFLKEKIVEAFGRLGCNENRVLKALLETLEDEAPSLRLSAIESLVEVGDLACIPALKDRLFDAEDDVAVAAAWALYQLGGETLVRRLLDEQDNLPQFIREELEGYVP